MRRLRKKQLVVLGALAWGCAMAATSENPIVRMFPLHVVYRQGFDDATLMPDVGRVAKVQDAASCEFAEGGVFGRCLSAGRVRLGRDADGRSFMDTQTAGTAVCWVRYVQDPPEGRRTGFTFLIGDMVAPPGQRGRLLALKLHDNGIVFLFENFVGKKRITASAMTAISFEDWKKNEWRMFAFSWGGGKIGISQNGADFSEVPCERRLLPLADGIEIRAPEVKERSRLYQIDEFAVLDRKLTNNEVLELYRETMKCRR